MNENTRYSVSFVLSSMIFVLFFFLLQDIEVNFFKKNKDSHLLLLGGDFSEIYTGYELEVQVGQESSLFSSALPERQNQTTDETPQSNEHLLTDENSGEPITDVAPRLDEKYLFTDSEQIGIETSTTTVADTPPPRTNINPTSNSFSKSKHLAEGEYKHSISNRNLIFVAPIGYYKPVEGRVEIHIKVDRLGKIVYAKVDPKNCTILDTKLWDACEKSLFGSRFDKNKRAPEIQTGKIYFSFKLH